MSTPHNNPIAHNGQPTLAERQFLVAFNVPNSPQQNTNLTQLWSLKASEAIGALIDFRSAVHRWQAAGRVNEAEFTAELQRLEDCGLAGWTDELIAAAMLEVLR